MSRGPVSAVSQTAAQRKRGLVINAAYSQPTRSREADYISSALSRSAGRRYSSRSLSESSRGRHETPGIAEVTSGGESSADSAGCALFSLSVEVSQLNIPIRNSARHRRRRVQYHITRHVTPYLNPHRLKGVQLGITMSFQKTYQIFHVSLSTPNSPEKTAKR